MGQQKSVVCHENRSILSATKIVRFYCPTRTLSILDEKIAEHVLECRAVIGQKEGVAKQDGVRVGWGRCFSFDSFIRWPVNLKQMHDQQITYLSCNQRWNLFFLSFYVVSQSTSQATYKRLRLYRLPFFCRHCRDVRSDVCHGSRISSADFLRQLNQAHKSWPTLSIVWQPL